MRKPVLFMALVTLGAFLCACGENKNKGGNSAPQPTEEVTSEPEKELIEEIDVMHEPVENEDDKVYCRAFDGFFNLREKPNNSSNRVGKFYNGPEGAEVLFDDEEEVKDWVKIDAGGVVGYIHVAYLQKTPTEPYTGTTDPSWVQGAWIDDPGLEANYDLLCLYDSGVWVYTSCGEAISYGLYRLKNDHEVHFDTAWYKKDVFEEELEFDKDAKTLGGFYKLPSMNSSDANLYKKVRKPFYDVAAEMGTISIEKKIKSGDFDFTDDYESINASLDGIMDDDLDDDLADIMESMGYARSKASEPEKTSSAQKSSAEKESADDLSADAAYLKYATNQLRQFKKDMDAARSGRDFRKALNAYNDFVDNVPKHLNEKPDNEIMKIDGGEAYLDAIDDFLESWSRAKEKYGEDYF